MREDLQAQYEAILDAHLSGAGESASLEAYDFARMCMREGLAPEDIMALHLNRLERERDPVQRHKMEARGQELLIQVVMAFSLHYQQALRELESTNQELETASRFKTRMLSMVAHDLTNHIVAARLVTQALARGGKDGEQQRRIESLVQIIDDEEELIKNLLDIGRIESGRLDLDIEPLDLMQLIERSLARARTTTTRHDFSVSGPRSLMVMADRSKTQQVLDNLIGNAVKYSPLGGTVKITVGTRNREAEMAIEDQGLGIVAEDLPHIFEPFYRGRMSHGDIKGTGLGLAIVRSLLRLQRGSIDAEQAAGGGSIFRFTLPLA
ncbi:MAG: ATP-binding protein [Candidatus Xenobia bacterium]